MILNIIMLLRTVLMAALANLAITTFAQEPKLMLPIGHTALVVKANFSPDEKKILTASYDGTAKLWDVASGKLLQTLEGHTSGIVSAEFSLNGKRIITASMDSTSILWDAVNGKLLHRFNGHTNRLNSALFSQDGKKVMTSSDDRTVKIWNAQSGKFLYGLEMEGYVKSALFSPDGKKIVTADHNGVVKIWDALSGKLLHSLKGGQFYNVNAAVFSFDGKKVLTILAETTMVWDMISGKLLQRLEGHKKAVVSAVFSVDGKRVLTTSKDKTAMIWDATSGKILYTLGHTDQLLSGVFNSNGKKVLTTSIDKTADVWDAESGEPILTIDGLQEAPTSAAFSKDGKKVLIASGITAKIWDAFTGDVLQSLNGHTSSVNSAAFNIDGGKIVIASGNTAKIWDALSKKLTHNLEGHKKEVVSAVFSPDGKMVLTASEDSTAKLWDASNGLLLHSSEGHEYPLSSAVFSPDGKMVQTSGYGTVKLWDVVSGTLLDVTEGVNVYDKSVVLSSDGKMKLTWDHTHTVKLWDALTGSVLYTLEGHTSILNSAIFSVNGKMVLTASHDGTAKLWDALTGQIVHDFKGHKYGVESAVFSLDGRRVLTGSLDNTCKLWDAQTGKLLYTFFAVDSTDYLVVDDQNRYDGTPNARKLLYFTCDDEVIELDQVKDQLWVPGLAERIMKGETINAKTLNDLNICGLVPLVEEKDNTNNQYQFQITLRRGGLGETVLYVNGIEAKRYQNKDLQQKGNNYELNVSANELSAFMVAGQENKITVKAYTKDNAISSRGATLLAANNTNAPTVIPNLYAVVVGVNDYKGTELDLKYAAKDATDLSNALGHSARKLLNTDGKEHVFIYNLTTAENRYQLPEKNSIKKVIEDIGKKATSSDILLLFFAGHGVTGTTTNDKQFYFLTADASKSSAIDAMADVGISTAELSEWIKPQNLKAQKRILIFDACNSGQAIKDFVNLGQQGQNYIAARDDDKARQIKAIDKLNEKSGLFILSASASNQVAYEMGRYSQGMLTYALLSTIKQQPDILQDDKYLDVSRWFGAAEKMVTDLAKDNGARQQPQVISTTNFTIGLVDDEIRAKIVLPMEKPLFTSSNFQNANDDIAYDDKGLSKLVDQQLFDIASRGTNTAIVYTPNVQLEEAWIVSGRYEIIGTSIKARINIRQGKSAPKHRIEISGTTDKLDVLAKEIVQQVTNFVQSGN